MLTSKCITLLLIRFLDKVYPKNSGDGQVESSQVLVVPIWVYAFIKGLHKKVGHPQLVNECTNWMGAGEIRDAIQRVFFVIFPFILQIHNAKEKQYQTIFLRV